MMKTRREFLNELTLTGTAGLLGVRAEAAGAEPPPETTRFRPVVRIGSVCAVPMLHMTEEFLRGEGFTEQYVEKKTTVEIRQAIASGEGDMTQTFLGPTILLIDAGDPIVLLAGVHVGCLELFGTDRVRTIRDLKGKVVSVTEIGSGRHIFLAAAMAHVGLDARKDVHFAAHSPAESMRLLAEGRIDGYQAFSEEVAEMRAKKIGHVILDGTTERPWSQYFCCMAAVNRDFAEVSGGHEACRARRSSRPPPCVRWSRIARRASWSTRAMRPTTTMRNRRCAASRI